MVGQNPMLVFEPLSCRAGRRPHPWLLEGDDPSVSYFTLTELLGAELDDPEVVVAQRAIMDCGTVPAILAAQAADGPWGAVTTTMRPSTAAPPGSSSCSPRSVPTVPTSACAAAARRSCPMHRTLSQAASPWPAPRRSEAACTAPSSPAFPATWSGVSSGSACWTTRGCSAASSGSPLTGASRTATARHPPAGPTTGGDVLGASHLPHGRGHGAQGPRRDPAGPAFTRGRAYARPRRRVHAAPSRPQAQSRPGEGLQAGVAAPRLPAHVPDRRARDPRYRHRRGSGCQKACLPAEGDIVGAGRIPSWGGTGYWPRGNPTVSSKSVVFGQHGLAGAALGTRDARDIDIAGIGGEVIEAAQQPNQARRGEAGRALLLPE